VLNIYGVPSEITVNDGLKTKDRQADSLASAHSPDERYAIRFQLDRDNGRVPTETVLPNGGTTGFSFRHAAPNGFGLLELLVSVAIIAVLAALVFTAMGALRSSADSAKCVANLRQIGVLMHMYFNDHNGWAPPHSGWAFGEPPGAPQIHLLLWTGRLAPYFEPDSYYSPMSSLFTCPSDPDHKTWPEARSYLPQGVPGIPESAGTQRMVSYGYNYVIFTGNPWFHYTRPTPPTNVRNVGDPSDVILVADSMPASKGGLNPSQVFWFNQNLWPDKRHRGSFNALFLDGSVRWLPYKQATSGVTPTGRPYWSWAEFPWQPAGQ